MGYPLRGLIRGRVIEPPPIKKRVSATRFTIKSLGGAAKKAAVLISALFWFSIAFFIVFV